MSDDSVIAYDFSQLNAVIDEFKRRGGNIAELSAPIAEDMVAEVIRRFEEQSGYTQGAWEPLADGTLAARRKSKDPQALKDTDNLFGSITPYSEDDLAEAFTNVPYAKYHISEEPRQTGADGEVILPRRDFMDIDWDTVTENAMDLLLMEVVSGE